MYMHVVFVYIHICTGCPEKYDFDSFFIARAPIFSKLVMCIVGNMAKKINAKEKHFRCFRTWIGRFAWKRTFPANRLIRPELCSRARLTVLTADSPQGTCRHRRQSHFEHAGSQQLSAKPADQTHSKMAPMGTDPGEQLLTYNTNN